MAKLTSTDIFGELKVTQDIKTKNAEITKEGNINSFRLLPASNINSSTYNNAAIEIRELNKNGPQTGTWAVAPRLAFHWGGRVASQIALRSDAKIAIS